MTTADANSPHSTDGQPSANLRVRVDAVPDPGGLRPAIEAALAARPWPAGPEADVAAAVMARVADAQQRRAEPW